MPPVAGAKRLLFRKRLTARIDHPRADRRVLRPTRNETPAHSHELALALVTDPNDRHVVRRRDVVMRIDVRRMREAERKRDRSGIAVQLVATAHRQPAALEPLADAEAENAPSDADASTRRAVFATCSVSQYAYAPTAAAPAIGIQRLADVPMTRCVSVTPRFPSTLVNALDESCWTIAR